MYCKSCGKIVDNDSKFCMHCGAKLFSDNETIQEQDKSSNILSHKAEIKPESNLSIKNIKSVSVSPLINSQKDVLEEFAVLLAIKKIAPPRKIVGLVISFIGTLMLALYVSLLLTHYPLIPDTPLYKFWGVIWLNPYFGIHITAIYSFFFLFIGSILLFKSNPIVLNKITSIAIDGIIFLSFLFLVQYLFLGNHSTWDDSDISYLLFYNVFGNKIIAMSVFFLTYYLISELSGGTFGKKTARLISQNDEKDNISFKQGLIKTSVYAIPVWILTIIMLIDVRVLNHLNDSVIFQLCQLISFIIVAISIFMIFISKENYSLAEVLSKTIVTKRLEKAGVSEVILDAPLNITEQIIQLTPESYNSDNFTNNLLALHKLIGKEKRRLFSTQNETIINFINEIITDEKSFIQVNEAYKKQYSIDLFKDLMSISASYGTIYFYVEPFINIGICEKEFPHKIIKIDQMN